MEKYNPTGNARVTQLGECLFYKQDVGSSSLSVCTAKVATDKEISKEKASEIFRRLSSRNQTCCLPSITVATRERKDAL